MRLKFPAVQAPGRSNPTLSAFCFALYFKHILCICRNSYIRDIRVTLLSLLNPLVKILNECLIINSSLMFLMGNILISPWWLRLSEDCLLPKLLKALFAFLRVALVMGLFKDANIFAGIHTHHFKLQSQTLVRLKCNWHWGSWSSSFSCPEKQNEDALRSPVTQPPWQSQSSPSESSTADKFKPKRCTLSCPGGIW